MMPAPGAALRIASLDGARAVSIGLVILSHLQLLRHVPLLWRLGEPDFFAYGPYLDSGNLGVRVFFVISGFLITHILLEEERRTGSISLRRFYARRVVRIIPAYWAYLTVIAILIPTGIAAAHWSELASAFVYITDYRIPHGSLTHTWSLSVEEQFYLLWPALLVLLGGARGYRACLIVLVTAPLLRTLSDLGIVPTSSKFSFGASCDALAVGCLLALLRERLWRLTGYRRLVSSPAVFLTPLAALPLMSGLVPFYVRDLIGIPLLNVCVAMALDRCMRYPVSLSGRFLNLPVLVWLGTLSYSLYLWQQFWAFGSFHVPAPLRLTGILLCACGSYYLIEQPLLALRARLRRVPLAQSTAAASA